MDRLVSLPPQVVALDLPLAVALALRPMRLHRLQKGVLVTAEELAQVVADQAERNGLAVRDVLRAVALAMGARELQDGAAIEPGRQVCFEVPLDH